MVDRALRPLKARLLAPTARALARWPADAVTAAGAGVGLAAAVLAALGRFDLALLAWWSNRVLDGLDGEIARGARRGGSAAGAQRGAYLDLMADLLVYAALPLGLAAGAAGTLTGTPAIVDPAWAVWAAASAAVAAFYLNLGSWTLLAAALAEAEGPRPSGHDAPGIRMPAGLMEGAETIVAFSVALLWPATAVWTLGAIALLTLLSAAHRTRWGVRRLGRGGRP